MMAALKLGSFPVPGAALGGAAATTKKCERSSVVLRVVGDGGGDNGFPSFLPKEVEKIKDPFARNLARRIKRLPVQIECSDSFIMSSCVQPLVQSNSSPVVLLHCFDSSCLEWRRAYPLLENSGLEAWAIDVLGWGFSDLGRLPPCDVASKRLHLYQLWKCYIKRPVVLVGPSLGAAVAIDFAVNYPEVALNDSYAVKEYKKLYRIVPNQLVDKLVLINPSVYAEGTGNLAKLPKVVAYAGVSLLKTFPLRLYGSILAFDGIPLSKNLDWTNVGRLHCHMPWWKDATVSFMVSGGYNVVSQIKQVEQKTLIICGENDKIVSNQLAMRLLFELPEARMQRVPGSGHLPHVEKPHPVARLIADFCSKQ